MASHSMLTRASHSERPGVAGRGAELRIDLSMQTTNEDEPRTSRLLVPHTGGAIV